MELHFQLPASSYNLLMWMLFYGLFNDSTTDYSIKLLVCNGLESM